MSSVGMYPVWRLTHVFNAVGNSIGIFTDRAGREEINRRKKHEPVVKMKNRKVVPAED